MDRMHVSHLVRRLVDQDQLQRQRTASDQRTWMISLTDQGRACLAVTLPIVETFDAAFFEQSALA
jgi:DNA-binding MarR family transcriptional regulator